MVASSDEHFRETVRDQLLNLTQGRNADQFDRSIDLLVSRVRQQQPVELVYPDQGADGLGCFLVPNAVVLIAGAPHPDTARKLIDYLLSKEVEAKLARSDAAQIPLHPGVEGPPELRHLGVASDARVWAVGRGLVPATGRCHGSNGRRRHWRLTDPPGRTDTQQDA